MAKKRLDTMVGEHDYNSMLAATTPTPHVATVEITAGDADIPAGTVLVKDTAATVKDGSSDVANPNLGKYAPIKAPLTGESIVLVLTEDVAAGSGTQVVTAYKTGNFVRGRLLAGGDYELAATDFDYMRQAGILSEDAID